MQTIGDRIKAKRLQLHLSQDELAKKLGYKSRSSINKIEMDSRNLTQSKIKAIADALETTPSYIMGWEQVENDRSPFSAPTTAEDTALFYPIGTVAAHYDNLAVEELSSDPIEIPTRWLHGRPKEDFFMLRVSGDSMYPLYHDGDHVLVLRQETLDRSGDIGVILYDGEQATLKKVEYVMGEDWLRLVPLNPNYPPLLVEGAALEQCRVLGVPKLLVREL